MFVKDEEVEEILADFVSAANQDGGYNEKPSDGMVNLLRRLIREELDEMEEQKGVGKDGKR
jgi:hypothetical protein